MKLTDGMVAVITGAASGIGYALAHDCAARGMTVVLADVEDEALRSATASLESSGATVRSHRTDVTRPDDLEALAASVFEEFGVVHLLCNNAGVMGDVGLTWALEPESWEWVLRVNLLGVVNGLRAFVPRLLEQAVPSHILNTVSIAGLIPTPYIGSYTATKYAVMGVSETLDQELKSIDAKVGVSVLCPGEVRTRIADSARNRPAELTTGSTTQATAVTRDVVRSRMPHALEAEEVATIALDGVESGRFYVFTHPAMAELIERRFQRIRE